MPDDDVEAVGGTEFQPGWPEIYPLGLIIARTHVSQRRPADDADLDAEDDVDWALHCAARPGSPRFAFIGDLVVSNPLGFGGVTVVMPFALRDEPAEIGDDERDAMLRQYGTWAAGFMYDHAALALRTAVAGNGNPLDVPFGTPDVDLHTSDVERSDDEGAQAQPDGTGAETES